MRVKALKSFYFLMLFCITLRLFYWQIIRSDDLAVLADQQHLVVSKISAPRGIIYSKDRAILVSNQPSYILFGLPKLVKNKEEVSFKLAKLLIDANLKPDETPDPEAVIKLKDLILQKLSNDLNWVLLYKGISLNLKDTIEKLKYEGIGFETISARFYPEASTAAHILGFVADDPLGRQVGYFGLEGYYNRQLQGVGGVTTEEKDAFGIPILVGKFLKREPIKGHDLILNVDRTVQFLVERQLKIGMEKYKPKSASVVVMDPKTGAILAMASYPNYDPSKLGEFAKESFKNPIVADSYEPGSTFKVLVMAAAINEGVIKPDTVCDICSGPITVGQYQIKTWNNKYYPDTNLTDVIVHSDNTGMVFTARKLGLDKLYQYIEAFGFGKSTSIDLQDETVPILRDKGEWREIDLATASFGQGIAVTPIQMIKAVAAIANGGKLMEPHIVEGVKDKDEIKFVTPKVVSQPISEATAKTMTEMMVKAVSDGEAKAFVPKGFKIAGKTGTAQIPVAGHYDPDKTVASFVGFAPSNDPKFVMLVQYVEPKTSIFGSETAAPTFFEIAKELFSYYRLSPDN